MLGSRVGPYRILTELGRGSAGVVYHAAEQATGKQFALKQLEVSDKSHLRRFQKEAQAARLLSHPNIVTVFELLAEDGRYFLVMEYVQGTPLSKRIKAGGFEESTAMTLLRQAAEAIDYAHHKGIVHRDIKPENLLIRTDGTLKLVDFGIAKAEDIDANFTRVSSSPGMMGSPHYMAPEQITGQTVTPQTDQFSLGVIAWELLTGCRPFDGDSIHAVTYQIAHEAPQNLAAAQGRLRGMCPVLLRALEKDPVKRFNSCVSFVAALERPPVPSLWQRIRRLLKL